MTSLSVISLLCAIDIFGVVGQQSGWLQSDNAAGLDRLPVEKVSTGGLTIRKENGDLTNYSDASEALTWSAGVSSLYRVNSRITLSGEVDYRNFVGQKMSGSVLISPESQPFDLVEYTENCEGKKQLEQYHLMGAVGALYRRWSFGGKIDYTSANYAKQRDLRHQNRLMDMKIAAGATYIANSHLRLGANLIYRRSVEGISFNIAGTTDKVHHTMVSYGAFFGTIENATALNGIATTSGGDQPLVNTYKGAALQAEWNISDNVIWYNEFTYLRRSGYYGRESSYSVVWSEHDGQYLEYRTNLRFDKGHNQHLLEMRVFGEKLDNNENLYNTVNQGGGFTEIVYYAKDHRLSRTETKASVLYTFYIGMDNYQPKWAFRIGADLYCRNLKASYFPLYRKQDIRNVKLYAEADRGIDFRKGRLDISLGAGMIKGDGTKAKDGTYDASSTNTAIHSCDRYLDKEYTYLTRLQYIGQTETKYSIKIKDLHPYVSAGLETRHLDKDNYHLVGQVKIGIDF